MSTMLSARANGRVAVAGWIAPYRAAETVVCVDECAMVAYAEASDWCAIGGVRELEGEVGLEVLACAWRRQVMSRVCACKSESPVLEGEPMSV